MPLSKEAEARIRDALDRLDDIAATCNYVMLNSSFNELRDKLHRVSTKADIIRSVLEGALSEECQGENV